MKNTTSFAVIFYILLFVPSLFFVALNQGSMAVGLVFFIPILIFYLLMTSRNRKITFGFAEVIFFFLLLALVLLHSLPMIVFRSDFNSLRFFYSYAGLLLIAFGALLFSSCVRNTNPLKLSWMVRCAIIFLLMNAIIGLTGIKIFPYSTLKPVGIFSEPSHLALLLAPLLAYACAIKDKKYKFFLVSFLAWGILIENVTVIIVVIMCFIINLKLNTSTKSIWLIFLGVVISAVVVNVADFNFLISRLEISRDSDNLSVLVLLQGWENALIMMMNTGGWGAGFQQFGVSNELGQISEKIVILSGGMLNEFDGGSTAAKLVGEFGIFGWLGILILSMLSFKAFVELRKIRSTQDKGGNVLLIASLYTIVIELFIRGVGYFSPTVFLALCAIYGLLSKSPNIDPEFKPQIPQPKKAHPSPI